MEMLQKKVLMMAGGTGGHIFPALAIADEMKRQHCEVIWLGTKKGMESRIVPENNYAIEYIDISGMRGKGLTKLITMPYQLIKAVIQTLVIFKRIQPDLAIGMGGFVTGPGGLVSWIMRKPLVIHEQNAISGTSNNILSLFANQRLCAFPNAYKHFFLNKWNKKSKCLVTGNPVRKDILALKKSALLVSNEKKKKVLNILVVGGSLGAQKINTCVPQAIKKIQQTEQKIETNYSQYHIRHQCGKGKSDQVKKIIAGNFFSSKNTPEVKYELEEFITDMASAYQWADIIICRSGALTVSEIMAVGITAILIPFPYAVSDHQTANAKYISDNGAGFLLMEKDMDANSLGELISLCHVEKLAEMSAKAKTLAKPNATKEVVEQCLSQIESDITMTDANEANK